MERKGGQDPREMVWLERITPNQLDGKSGAGREGGGRWRLGRFAFLGIEVGWVGLGGVSL